MKKKRSPRYAEMRAYFDRLEAEGKCKACVQPNPDAGMRLMCPPCRVKMNLAKKRKSLARAALGACHYCDRSPWNGHPLCRKHVLAQRLATAKHRGLKAKARQMSTKKKGRRMTVKS